MPNTSTPKTAYFFDTEVGDQYYCEHHPMKPYRVRLTHELVCNYDLYKKMDIYRPFPLSKKELTAFHSKGYVNFLKNVTVETKKEYDCDNYLGKSFDSDCPVFDGLYPFCQLAAGASVGAADLLAAQRADVAINWAGGYHHAKKARASGFCYVNDIVLAILRLLKRFARVLYVDIDVHHGDGVEEAFYTNPRVLTLSFHKGGNFFPGTGHVEDVGADEGRFFAVNFPLHSGMDDDGFFAVFRPVFDRVREAFRPEAIVLQCGADSLTGDRLGCFNLTVLGHGRCVGHVIEAGLPTLVVGGGGYTVKNVARCWTYETAVCLGSEIPNELPYNIDMDKFGPDYCLQIKPSKIENLNFGVYIDATKEAVFENLKALEAVPSVQIGDRVNGRAIHGTDYVAGPNRFVDDDDDDSDEEMLYANEKKREDEKEFYDYAEERPKTMSE